MNREVLFIDIFKFIRHPVYERETGNQRFFRKLWDVTRVWTFGYVIALPLGVLITLLTQISKYNLDQNGIYSLITNEPPLLLFMLIAIWAPVSEELGFRLWLRYSPFRLSVPIGYWFYVVLSFATNTHLITQKSAAASAVTPFALSIFMALLMGFILKMTVSEEKAVLFYRKHFRWLFYTSSFAFGLAHLFNYNNFQHIWYLIPILFLPQLIIGGMFGYVRMKYGVAWSITTHSLYNFFLFLPQIFLQFLSKDALTALNSNDLNHILSSSPNGILIIFLIDGVFLLITLLTLISGIQFIKELRTRHLSTQPPQEQIDKV